MTLAAISYNSVIDPSFEHVQVQAPQIHWNGPQPPHWPISTLWLPQLHRSLATALVSLSPSNAMIFSRILLGREVIFKRNVSFSHTPKTYHQFIRNWIWKRGITW